MENFSGKSTTCEYAKFQNFEAYCLQLKIQFPTEKAIMDGMGAGRPACGSHLIYNVAETLYICNEQEAEKNIAAIKPKIEIIKLNKNLKFSCLSALEEKQI